MNPNQPINPVAAQSSKLPPGVINGVPLIYVVPATQLEQAMTGFDIRDVFALVLSGILPGLGHVMMGQATKGLAIFAATVLTCGMGYLLVPLVCVDILAVMLARKKRRVGAWEMVPR
jgi:TM2 domain-containing membrane protein YozV